MKHHCPLPTLFLLVGACIALPVHAFERVQAGQWTGKTLSGGKTFPTSSCISPHDAQLLNGDAKSVRAYLETIIPASICKISDVKAEGNQIIYTASCGSNAATVVTTSYYGSRSEGFDSTGGKSEAKWVGPCK
jgi:hypothetical protein